MDDEKNLTPEQIAAEKAQAELPKEDEVRAAIVAEFGFDAETDKERIDKATAKEMKARTDLSKAISQKIKHRDRATVLEQNAPKPPEPQKKADDKPVADQVKDALEQRDLDDMDYPDELKAEIKRIAQITGKSVKAAARDPYLAAKIAEHEKTVKTDKAALSQTGNKSGGTASGFDKDAPPLIDSSSPDKFKESSKKYQEWKDWMIKNGN